jgi:YVTN family beta-propeller protein
MKKLKINKGIMVLFAVVILAIVFGGVASAAEKETSYKVIKKITIGGDGGWDWLTADSKLNRLYISHQSHVVIFDCASEKVIGDINNTPGVHCIATAHTFNKGFISNGGDNSVTVFDLTTLKETGRIKVGTKPDAIMFDHETKRIFVFNGGSKDCNVIDANTNKIIGSISLDGKPEFAVSNAKGRVFVNLEDKSEIVEIDAQKMVIKNRWPLAPGEEPSGLAIDHKNMRLFSVCSNGKMAVVDYNSGKVVATPEIGQGPDAAGFDSEAGLAFSSNGKDGTLTIVKEETPMEFKVIQTLTTAPLARTMAVNSKTHLVYLVTAKLKPPVPGQEQGRKKSYEPGTFELLIVGPSEK